MTAHIANRPGISTVADCVGISSWASWATWASSATRTTVSGRTGSSSEFEASSRQWGSSNIEEEHIASSARCSAITSVTTGRPNSPLSSLPPIVLTARNGHWYEAA